MKYMFNVIDWLKAASTEIGLHVADYLPRRIGVSSGRQAHAEERGAVQACCEGGPVSMTGRILALASLAVHG